ncbi:hypothetical protein LIPSTDRAFT_71897 [Lipomyces starkeyi NRRL Y-11557]|uniref:Uncharacterized protein n=1 Tax=Lipomyces starkeyi NRRL Y-11557 TaxID=675824 RepID=A0A1E3Q3W0_LIPST|nr:hypothetical protein LIPSTDRAFT_71897 [Lipomyces starkeyi NRRL Y-11557]
MENKIRPFAATSGSVSVLVCVAFMMVRLNICSELKQAFNVVVTPDTMPSASKGSRQG